MNQWVLIVSAALFPLWFYIFTETNKVIKDLLQKDETWRVEEKKKKSWSNLPQEEYSNLIGQLR